jgi:multicomponent Na+:H+ antiporter subunit E
VRLTGRAALLVVLWLLAWGDLSLANVLSGAAVAAVLLIAFPLARRAGKPVSVDALGVIRLVGAVAAQLVVSNIVMTREILRRRSTARPGVLVHRLDHPSEVVVTLMTSIISLSPGTMTVHAAEDSSEIAVHFYDLRDVEAGRGQLRRLEQRAVAALGGRRLAAPHPTEEDRP